ALAAMKRINDLVRKLVDAGRVAAVPAGFSTVPVADLVGKAAAEARARGGARIAVVEHAAPGLSVRARREALEQVLSILVANAIEAVPDGRGGQIELRAEHAGGRVRLSVRDDGAGMGSEVLRRAFDPFFTTKPSGGGAGLGLPVARGIVEASGGTLHLESAPGEGTTAVVELPDAIEATPHG
ncbi:MAG TPA: HAMP domain-containing sensor histidine kinase, partial [Anaeromyxobacter sp.]